MSESSDLYDAAEVVLLQKRLDDCHATIRELVRLNEELQRIISDVKTALRKI